MIKSPLGCGETLATWKFAVEICVYFADIPPSILAAIDFK